MKINYTITGTLTIDESVYKDVWQEDGNDKEWDSLSAEEKTDFIKEVESDNGYECITDDPDGSIAITSIEL